MSSNKCRISKDWVIESFWVGDQNANTVEQMREELKPLIEEVKAKGKPVLILADITQLGKPSLSSRQVGYKLLKELNYKKAAIFGSFGFEGLVRAVILASGCGFKVKFFRERSDAESWLKEDA